MITEINLFKNNKYELILRYGDDKAKGQGYKTHSRLLIKDDEDKNNREWLDIIYKGEAFDIKNANFLKWYLPKYVIEEINKSIEIYNKYM